MVMLSFSWTFLTTFTNLTVYCFTSFHCLLFFTRCTMWLKKYFKQKSTKMHFGTSLKKLTNIFSFSCFGWVANLLLDYLSWNRTMTPLTIAFRWWWLWWWWWWWGWCWWWWCFPIKSLGLKAGFQQWGKLKNASKDKWKSAVVWEKCIKAVHNILPLFLLFDPDHILFSAPVFFFLQEFLPEIAFSARFAIRV